MRFADKHAMIYRGYCGGFMKSRYFVIVGLLVSLFLFLGAIPANAASGSDRYVRLRHMEGDVTIYPEDGQRSNEASINSPVLDGDVVETQNGRAELSFRNGILVRLGDYSAARIISTYSPMTIELLKGSLFVDSHMIDSFREELEVRAGDAEVFLIDEGNLRIDLGDQGGVRITTIQGEAEVRANGQRVLLHPQERTYVDAGNSPDTPEAFNGDYDELDDWNSSRMNSLAYRDSYRDESYVDESLYYDTYDLQDYGDWRYYGSYGNVWVPNVYDGWRPYYDGRWTYSPGGWFWVSYEPWGWAPYHYGRWGWAIDFGWYWIPGYTFGPSWVSWYDYGDYIGWCPLNYYNRPIYTYNYWNPVQKQKTIVGADNSWTFVKKHDVGAASVKKISIGSDEIKKIHFDETKIIRSPAKQLTSYVIPKTAKTPAYVNDHRIVPSKTPDIKNPIGVDHREEWPGRSDSKNVSSADEDSLSPSSTKTLNTRPSSTPKPVTPAPSSNKSMNKSPGSTSTNSSNSNSSNSSNTRSSTSSSKYGSGSNDKKVSKPAPPHYTTRDEQFERLRSTYERDINWYRKESSSPYDRSESPNTRKNAYDSDSRSTPWFRDPKSYDDSRDNSEVSPRYLEGARKMFERFDERQPSSSPTVSPRNEPKSESVPRYEPRNDSSSKQYSKPSSVQPQSMKSSTPSRPSSQPSAKPIKKKD